MSEMQIERSPLRREIGWLLQSSLLIFVWTVAIGILNGTDLVEFNRNTLLSHVHAGTLGWITLGFFAVLLSAFSTGRPLAGWRASLPRPMALGAIVAAVLYAAAFWSGDTTLRPIAGSIMFLPVTAMLVWVVAQSRRAPMSVAQTGMLLGLLNLFIGAVLGIMLGLYLRGNLPSLPASFTGGHPVSMVIGYLVLAGLAIVEWRVQGRPTAIRSSKLGMAQVILPFLAAQILLLAAILNNEQLFGAYVPLQLITIIIFLVRLGRPLAAISWLAVSSGRHYVMSALFLVFNFAIITYLISGIISGRLSPDSPDPTFLGIILAMDHAMFIGVMTNILFGMVRDTAGRTSLYGWADQLIFWGMNIGLVGFVVGLLADSAIVKRISTPIMGLAILVAIAVYTLRLRAEAPLAVAPAGD
jgi:hypothetical protein